MPVDILLDTGAHGIDGNYISLDVVNQFQLDYDFEPPVTNNVSTCSGIDGSCTKNPKYVLILNVHLTRNLKLQSKFLFYHEHRLI